MQLYSIIHSLPPWCIETLKCILKLYHKLRSRISKKNSETKIDKHLFESITRYNHNRPLGPRKRICNAPFSSLYFGINGEVTACCFNRTFTLGNIPTHKILEIWKSSANQNLRNALSNYDFSLGCSMCQQTIQAGNFSGVGAITYDMAIINKNYPTSLKFELSNSCNLACIMCNENFSSSFAKQTTSTESIYDDSFIGQLDELIPNLYSTSFLGGEPFLIPIYYKIWDLIITKNPGCPINLQTNGTVLNERIKKLLNNGNFQISISIDSINKSTYEYIRKNASFEDVISNIKYFAENAKIRKNYFGLSFCPMQLNWKEIPDFVKYCNSLNAKLFFNYMVSPQYLSLKSLNHIQLKEILDFLTKNRIYEKSSIGEYNYKQYISFENQINSWYQTAKNFEENYSKFSNTNITELLMHFSVTLENYINTSELFSNEVKEQKITRLMSIFNKLKNHIENTDANRRKIFQLMNNPVEEILQGLSSKSDEEIIRIIQNE